MARSNDCRHKRSLYLWKSNQTKAVAGLPQRSRYEINSTSSLLFTISQIMVRIGDGLKLNHPGMEIATSIRWWMEQFRIWRTERRTPSSISIQPNWPLVSFLPFFHPLLTNIAQIYLPSWPIQLLCQMGMILVWDVVEWGVTFASKILTPNRMH